MVTSTTQNKNTKTFGRSKKTKVRKFGILIYGTPLVRPAIVRRFTARVPGSRQSVFAGKRKKKKPEPGLKWDNICQRIFTGGLFDISGREKDYGVTCEGLEEG